MPGVPSATTDKRSTTDTTSIADLAGYVRRLSTAELYALAAAMARAPDPANRDERTWTLVISELARRLAGDVERRAA